MSEGRENYYDGGRGHASGGGGGGTQGFPPPLLVSAMCKGKCHSTFSSACLQTFVFDGVCALTRELAQGKPS